ncbi:heavy-metal-associated domain-containing protein [Streptomyces sp. NPDC020799]|uniref:heavy-metal-associated domain-containing protein n=1 Tax=Streptomyces sp. NPDC020799 TaxID=3365091 RepID=UPI00378D318D
MSCCSPDNSCSTSAASRDKKTTGVTTVYEVKGMTCGHCETAVAKEVTAVAGVSGVSVDVAAGLVTVTTGTEPDDAQIAAAVDEAGYELTGRAENLSAR